MSGKKRKPKLESDHRMVHRLVRKTACEMAEVFYEYSAHDNTFYAYYPNMGFFMQREWRRFVFTAKQTLTTMLTGSYPETYKQQIYDALLDDATLPYAPVETQISGFPH